MDTNRRGQAVVEFALILPLLLLLLLGVIEGARMAWVYLTIMEAAREGARYAVSGQPFYEGNPWTFGPSLADGNPTLCLQGIDDFGTCNTTDPSASNAIDRVEAIANMVIKRAVGLYPDRYALASGVYTATGYYDMPGTMGVRVIGQTSETDQAGTVDHAGKEGLNVWVEAYYNMQLWDPIYSFIVQQVTGGQDFVRVVGAVQMQNEGVEAALGSIPPASIATPVPPQGGSGTGPSGLRPVILSPDGTTFEAGSSMRVRIEQHTPGNRYDIYLADRKICDSVLANNFGIAEVTCAIPPDFPPSQDNELYSTLHGSVLKEAGGVFITITRIGRPTLLVAEAYQWPAGSRITIQLRSHQPNTRYDLYFNGSVIGTSGPTDGYGDANFEWTIPRDTPAREPPSQPYLLESIANGTTTPVIASSGLYVTVAQIIVQGGVNWPAGSQLLANLRRHAPNRHYEVRCNGISIGSFATDDQGRSMANIMCTIPATAPDSPPYYVITSYDNGILIGQVDVTVSTPNDPYLVVVGGYDWPAGSPIDIQMFKHLPTRNYRLTLQEWTVAPSIATDGSGYAQTAYVIPITASAGTTYTLNSIDLVSSVIVATRTLNIRNMAQISVSQGPVVQPGSVIHINLTQHAAYAVYSLFLDNTLIGSVQTDANGEATYVYDLHNFPSTGGPFILESRSGTTRIAYTQLSIVAADLVVTNLELPPRVVFNTLMPITVTVRNSSTVPLSGVWFDTDIYVDPERVPDVRYPYPPGDYKLWLDYLAPGGSAILAQQIALYGAGDHHIYARVNTSKYIPEVDAGNPENNMASVTVAPDSCGGAVDEALTTDALQDNSFEAGWNSIAFGDASPGSQLIANDVISITSRGSGTTSTPDAGHYLFYRQVSGNFDVSVRARSQSSFSGISGYARFGLEIRDSTSANAPKVYLVKTRQYNLQYGYRATEGGSVERNEVTGSNNNLPVWLRIVRVGDDFTLYYSYTTNNPPQASDWLTWRTYRVVMSDPVLVGLLNSSSSASTANTVTFDNFHLCMDPANAARCGTVNEQSGLVVVDASNYTQNVPRGGKQWTEVMMSGRRVMQALQDTGVTTNTNYATTSPEVQYQVNIQTPGDYYVWVYGAGPNSNGDSLHVGLNGVPTSESDRIQLNSSGVITWTKDTLDSARAVIRNVAAGTNVINVWMREDGAYFYKILLTTNPNYVPTGEVEQSVCAISVVPAPYPPGMRVCTPPHTPLLTNGDFEQNPGWQTAWILGPGSNISAYNPHDSNLSLRMTSYQPGIGFRQPYAYQQFTMPDWITTTTTMNLSLWKSINACGTSEITDTLWLVLRAPGSPPTVVSTRTLVARGNEGYNFPDNYNFGQVDLAPTMRVVGYDPALYAGQPLQLYFYDDSNSLSCTSFGPTCFWTDFYLDDIKLEICTSQPVPEPDPTKATIKGSLRVWINGMPAAKQGVRVWAYRQNGPMFTTYTIHDSSYGFYLLDPGQYVIYSEWWEGSDLYNALTTVTVGAGVEYIKNLDLY